MALTLTELQATTDDYVEKVPVDIYFKSNIILMKLLSRGKTIPGGRKIQQILEYDAGNSGPYGNTTKLPLGKKDVFNAAFFPWGAYFGGLTIDLEDKRQNSGDLAIVDLVDGKLKNAQKSVRNKMGTQIYTARAANVDDLGNAVGFCGLADVFNTDKAVAYGEIKENDMAMWAANSGTATGGGTTVTDMNFTSMQALRQSASIDDNAEGKPNLYLTTELLKDAFEASLQTQVRYSDSKLVDAGFDNILFGGMPMVCDNKQTAGYCDALNLNFLDIKTHKDFNFTKPTWASPIDQPDVAVAFIRWSGQMTNKNRKAHGRFTGMTVPI